MATQSPELYLIAHKVRGEPAFDIAHQLQIGDELGWIIPTSGHRAYPWWWMELNRLGREGWGVYCEDNLWTDVPPMPDEIPDHYPVLSAPKGQGKHTAKDLVAALGIGRPKVTIARRI